MADYDENTDSYQDWAKTDSLYAYVEWPVFLETIGPVAGLNILDLACGEGRLSRVLMERGANSVIGLDISGEMIARALEQNEPGGPGPYYPGLSYRQLDARDETFALASPVDLVTALYLLHYAADLDELGQMCRLIARNLKPGGRFVTFTVSPESRFEPQEPRLEQLFGFRYDPVAPPEYRLVIGELQVPLWQWTKQEHEDALHQAGLRNVRWHKLALAADQLDLTPKVQWYLDNPCCIVLSAEKPV
ncbi:MAG: class I SAM-dependent methyltransferase [Pseudomonadota bacterium]